MRLFRRKQFEENMDAELRFHIESYIADLVRSGVNPEEAARRARIEFGPMEAKKDECRQAWGLQRLDEIRADLRLAFRALRWNPSFAAIAILSLALGIGANTAIFGVVDAVMLRLLPVRDPGQLVFLQMAGTAGRDGPPYPFFELVRDQAKSFEAVSAFSRSNMELRTDGARELVRGVWVSGNFYETLGVRPLIGRTLTGGDDAVAVISRAFWQQRFGGDPNIVGRAIQLFNFSVTIVGVMPSEIMSLEPGVPIDIAVPMGLSNPAMMRDRTALWLEVAGRLKPGVRSEQARAETGVLFQGYMADVEISAETRRRLFQSIEFSPAGQGLGGLRRQYSKPLTVLMILAGLVLLAACINTANLMLARASARQREFAVRLAIGAGRGRLIRQNLTEALVLTGAGAALGILVAHLGQTALLAFFAEGGNRIVIHEPLNTKVLLFTLAIAVLSGLALGILPAMRAASQDPADGLQGGSRSVAGNRASSRIGQAMAAVQVALSVALLAGAGLFLRSLHGLQSVDIGFAREGILTMEITPERELYGTPEWLGKQAALLEQIRSIPGVLSAGWATMNPMSGRDRGAMIDIPGFASDSESDKQIHLAAISPGYFNTLGMPILLGRDFTDRDNGDGLKVAILNETAARFYFGGVSPIGRKVRFTNYPGRDLLYEIAGVAKDATHDSLREAVSRFIYVPMDQSFDRVSRVSLAVRCSGDALTYAAPIQRHFRESSSPLLIDRISTMEKQIEQVLMRERLMAALSTTFGTIAAVLACIGLYGIMSYAVARRTKEIGIRMALGATRGGVVWMILRESLALAACGIVVSIPFALMLGQVTKTMLYGVEPFDTIAFAGAALLLLACTVLAAIVPGRRAALLDPTSALRRD